jgi:hypothetical protein
MPFPARCGRKIALPMMRSVVCNALKSHGLRRSREFAAINKPPLRYRRRAGKPATNIGPVDPPIPDVFAELPVAS